MKMLGLIDADFIKYHVAYDIGKMYEAGYDETKLIPEKSLHQLIERRIAEIYNNVSGATDKLIFLFSGKTGDNFRSKIAAERKYKGTRKYKPKYALEYKYKRAVDAYIMTKYDAWIELELEADDLCTMAHNENTFIYSYDKDLRNSPGLHYDIKLKEFVGVTNEEGFKSLLIQSITGDSVDAIPGAPGVGKVTANKALDGLNSRECIKATIDIFNKKGDIKNNFDRFVEMYQLVNLKTNRGEWLNEKYEDFFKRINELINDEGKSDLI